uniref:Uncharacterized protein n=1 Tax=Knipowitschia caucasica TaxID=637954 RepID=A0AAV2LLN3_KNICA
MIGPPSTAAAALHGGRTAVERQISMAGPTLRRLSVRLALNTAQAILYLSLVQSPDRRVESGCILLLSVSDQGPEACPKAALGGPYT